MQRRTKIVCTLGPASWSRERIDSLIAAGMDVDAFAARLGPGVALVGTEGGVVSIRPDGLTVTCHVTFTPEWLRVIVPD